jgi:hypothetical protein
MCRTCTPSKAASSPYQSSFLLLQFAAPAAAAAAPPTLHSGRVQPGHVYASSTAAGEVRSTVLSTPGGNSKSSGTQVAYPASSKLLSDCVEASGGAAAAGCSGLSTRQRTACAGDRTWLWLIGAAPHTWCNDCCNVHTHRGCCCCCCWLCASGSPWAGAAAAPSLRGPNPCVLCIRNAMMTPRLKTACGLGKQNEDCFKGFHGTCYSWHRD